MSQNDLVCDLVVDAVVEWLGKKYRKSQIKLELAQINGDKPLNPWTVERIIHLARKKIRDIYNIDAVEFKGSSIEFYSSIIRNPKASLKYKLIAQQRLDILLGLEHLATDDPVVYAEKVKEAMRAMDASVEGTVKTEQESTSQESTSSKVTAKEKEQRSDSFEEVHDEKLAEALETVELADNGLSLKNK